MGKSTRTKSREEKEALLRSIAFYCNIQQNQLFLTKLEKKVIGIIGLYF